jgi:hypothetical protein
VIYRRETIANVAGAVKNSSKVVSEKRILAEQEEKAVQLAVAEVKRDLEVPTFPFFLFCLLIYPLRSIFNY